MAAIRGITPCCALWPSDVAYPLPPPAQLPDRLLSQLDTDRRHRYASSSPMPKLYTWWMQRLIATLVLTATLPVACWWIKEFERAHSHHGHSDDHGGGHGHGESHVAVHGDEHSTAAHGEPHEAVHAGEHGTAVHVEEHSTAAHAGPSPAAAHHRALLAHARRRTVECHDDPDWTSIDGQLKCADYESERWPLPSA